MGELKKKKSRQMPRRKRTQKKELEDAVESDETFAFIAGYTPGGAPYGVTWEEWERADEQPDGQ